MNQSCSVCIHCHDEHTGQAKKKDCDEVGRLSKINRPGRETETSNSNETQSLELNPELGTQNSKPRTSNSELKTRNSQNSELRTPTHPALNPTPVRRGKLGTRNSELRTPTRPAPQPALVRRGKLETRNSKLRTRNPRLVLPLNPPWFVGASSKLGTENPTKKRYQNCTPSPSARNTSFYET